MSKQRKNQIARMDIIFSKLIVERDNFVCQKCGEYGDSAHHVIPRRYLAVRWCLDNGLTLCIKHHVPYAHGKPALFGRWFIKIFKVRFDNIDNLRHCIKPDLDRIERELKDNRGSFNKDP